MNPQFKNMPGSRIANGDLSCNFENLCKKICSMCADQNYGFQIPLKFSHPDELSLDTWIQNLSFILQNPHYEKIKFIDIELSEWSSFWRNTRKRLNFLFWFLFTSLRRSFVSNKAFLSCFTHIDQLSVAEALLFTFFCARPRDINFSIFYLPSPPVFPTGVFD